MPIELDPLEKDLITDLLEKEFEEIRSELHHTRGHDYKESIKEREKLVRGLLSKLGA